MTVIEKPMPDRKPPSAPSVAPSKHKAPRIGFLRPGHLERAFIVLLYIAMAVLVVLSVIGTFYGLQAQSAPILSPATIYYAMRDNTNVLIAALVMQAVLSITQYGARAMARHDRRWWLLYLAVLAISVYYNWQAYWTPLNELTAWYIALALIVFGDVLPEMFAVRHD